MKNGLIGFALAALLVPSFAFASFDSNLRYGTAGSAVQELQEFLTTQGIYHGPITGNFFSLTLAAVQSFQTIHSLPSTGYFGPMSRAVANGLLATTLASSTADAVQNGDTAIAVVPVVQAPVIPAPVIQPPIQVPPIVQNNVFGNTDPAPVVQAPVVVCDDTPQVTITSFTLNHLNIPAVLSSPVIPLLDPESVAAIQPQINAIEDQLQEITGGTYNPATSDHLGRTGQLESQVNMLKSMMRLNRLYFAVSAHSQCPNSHWLVDELPGVGATVTHNYPSNDYPAPSSSFVHAFNGQFGPNDVGQYTVGFKVYDDQTVQYSTVNVTVTN